MLGSLESTFRVAGARGSGRDMDRERVMMGSDGRRFQRDGSAGPMVSEISAFRVFVSFRDRAKLVRERDDSPGGESESDGGVGSTRGRWELVDDGEVDLA